MRPLVVRTAHGATPVVDLTSRGPLLETTHLIPTATMGCPALWLRSTMLARSYCGQCALPVTNPPPCINTTTGNGAAAEFRASVEGTETLRVRHSVSLNSNSGRGSACCSSRCSRSQLFGSAMGRGLLVREFLFIFYFFIIIICPRSWNRRPCTCASMDDVPSLGCLDGSRRCFDQRASRESVRERCILDAEILLDAGVLLRPDPLDITEGGVL